MFKNFHILYQKYMYISIMSYIIFYICISIMQHSIFLAKLILFIFVYFTSNLLLNTVLSHDIRIIGHDNPRGLDNRDIASIGLDNHHHFNSI